MLYEFQEFREARWYNKITMVIGWAIGLGFAILVLLFFPWRFRPYRPVWPHTL